MAAPNAIVNGTIPDATKLMLWFNYLLAGKGVSKGTFATLDASAGTDPFIAISTDTREVKMFLGDRTLGINGWTTLGGY